MTSCQTCGGTKYTHDKNQHEYPCPDCNRPSPPLPSSRDCVDCGMIKDDTGKTYGWGLCDCGSFRRSPPEATTV